MAKTSWPCTNCGEMVPPHHLPARSKFEPKKPVPVFCDKCLRGATPQHGTPEALARLAEGSNKL